jgi:uncharacterized protein HemY
MSRSGESSATASLRAGREALDSGRWEDARGLFETALADRESAEAMEGLAMAAWWLDDAAAVIDLRGWDAPRPYMRIVPQPA